MKELFAKGQDLLSYLKNQEDEGIKKKVERLYTRIEDRDFEKPEVKYPNIILFSESWCPDCLVLAAALQFLVEKIPGLQVRKLPQKPHEEVLERHARDGKARIPLALFLDENYEQQGYLSERPESIQEKIDRDADHHKAYRSGRFMDELVGEVLKEIAP